MDAPVPGVATLWLGLDHLLSLTQTPYGESTKHINYTDIQSLTIRQTATWRVLTAACIIVFPAIIIMMISGMIKAPENWRFYLILYSSVLVFLTFITVWNLYSGPSCVCELHTAVQTTILHSLNRLKKAIPGCETIAKAVHAAQIDMNTPDS